LSEPRTLAPPERRVSGVERRGAYDPIETGKPLIVKLTPIAPEPAAVAHAAQEIGMGGIASGRHAADFIAAGASAVAIGTESFRDPGAGRRIAAGARRAVPRRSRARPCLDNRLIPYGGQIPAVSPQCAGTFRPLCANEQICSIKTPANQWKNAQGTRTDLKLRSRSR